MNEWYAVSNSDEIDTPALLIFPERVAHNIALLKEMVPDMERLRPHVKTHKSPDVTRMLLDAGIQKFKCATIAEAEMLAACGAPDVLLAYQPSHAKAERLATLVRMFPSTTFACLVDNLESAKMIDEVMRTIPHCLPVYIDLNVGMNRTGIAPGPEAIELYHAMEQLEGILPMGLHVYDGHLRDADLAIRKQRCDEAFVSATAMRSKLIEDGSEDPLIIAGGSPTFPIHAQRTDVECSPGTFIFWDDGYASVLSEQPFQWAAVIATRVISKPAPDLLCLDLGHKSIASENPLNKRIRFLLEETLEPIGQSEEHLVVRTDNADAFQVGQIIYGIPYHVCPTVALYDQVVVIRDGRATERWNILARDRSLTV